MDRPVRRFSIRRIMARVGAEWSGSDVELEIRAGLPGTFLKQARQGRSRERETAALWVTLEDFLDSVEPALA